MDVKQIKEKHQAGKKEIRNKIKVRVNLKTQLIAINVLIISAIMLVSTFVAISSANSDITDISNQLKSGTTKSLNDKLQKSAEISMGILKDKTERLLQEATILGNTEDTISLVEFGVIKKANELMPNPSSKEEMIKKFKKTAGILEYTRLANDLKRIMYKTGDAPQSVEIVDKSGEVRGKSTGLSPEYKEENNSDKVKNILAAVGGLEMTDVISTDNGLAVKAYGRVDVTTKEQNQPGILIVTLPLDIFFLNELKKIVDTDIVIFSKEKFIAGTLYLNGENINLGEQKEIFDKVVENHKEGEVHKTYINEDKKINHLFAYLPITNYKDEVIGMLGFAVSKADVQGAIKELEKNRYKIALNLIYKLVFVAVISILIGAIFVYIFAASVSKAIKNILSLVKKVGEGELDSTIKVTRKDEIGELAVGVNHMVENLREIVVKIKDTTLKLAASTTEISSAVDSSKETMGAIVETAEEIEKKSSDEKEKIENAFHYVGDITSDIKNVGTISEDANVKSQSSLEIAKEGGKSVEAAIESIFKIKKTVEDTSNIVNVLNEKTVIIDKVITVITGIAEQTNLLALNAAIEAARAGDVGKGFAVVANEVKKLANQSAEAAEEIRRIVEDIKGEARNVNTSVIVGIEEVEKGVSISQNAGEALKSIIKSVSETSAMISKINNSTEEEIKSSNKVVELMDEVNSASEETNIISGKIVEEAEEQMNTIHEISHGVDLLVETAEGLNEMIQAFKIHTK